MPVEEEEDDRIYTVVINDEEQYSIWFADRDIPAGWKEVGKTGPKAECLAHIKEVWTDMRPLSLRKQMEEWAKQPPPAEPPGAPPARHPEGKNELVERLEEPQAVQAGIRPEPTMQFFKEQLDRGYVFMRFVKTGTELGIRLDRDACELGGADFETARGKIKLVGDLVLNYNKVRYEGDLDLGTFEGTGRLIFVKEIKPGEASA